MNVKLEFSSFQEVTDFCNSFTDRSNIAVLTAGYKKTIVELEEKVKILEDHINNCKCKLPEYHSGK